MTTARTRMNSCHGKIKESTYLLALVRAVVETDIWVRRGGSETREIEIYTSRFHVYYLTICAYLMQEKNVEICRILNKIKTTS